MIYLGSDHRGFNLKENIKNWFKDSQTSFEDLGAESLDPNDDYPVYAELVAKKIQENPDSLGILICGSGAGVEIAANKFDGIRASLGKNPDQVRAARTDDNINVLVLAADFTTEDEAKDLIKAFIDSKFDKNPRHERRLEEITSIENKQNH